MENDQSIVRAKRRFHGAFRMGHQSHDVAIAIANSGDVAERSIRICRRVLAPVRRGISKHNLMIALEIYERRLIAKIISVAVRDRQAQYLPWLGRGSEGRVVIFNANVHLPAHESHS